MQKSFISLGLMSGTSGDGVDASLISSNGTDSYESIKDKYYEYDKEIYKQGQKQGKAEVERLDRIRGTDIKKILTKNKKALEWWTSI